MNSEQFVQWLRGFSDISGGCPDEKQWKAIKEKLAQVIPVNFQTYPVVVPAPINPQPTWVYPQPNYPLSPYTITC